MGGGKITKRGAGKGEKLKKTRTRHAGQAWRELVTQSGRDLDKVTRTRQAGRREPWRVRRGGKGRDTRKKT